MADGGVAGDPLAQLHASRGRAPLEQLLRPFMREVEPNLQINHRLAHHAEAKMARLDDARMHWADRDLVDTFTFHRQERKRCTIVLEPLWQHGIFAQRKVAIGPEGVSGQRSATPIALMPNRS